MKFSNAVFLIIAVVLLGGLFYFFKSQNQTPNYSGLASSPSSAETSSSSAQLSSSKNFELVVKSRKLVSGSETISVTQGDDVVIKITSDEDEELHLHGYDKSVDLQKDTPTELKFNANLTGRFPYELEKSKTEIGALEVLPK